MIDLPNRILHHHYCKEYRISSRCIRTGFSSDDQALYPDGIDRGWASIIPTSRGHEIPLRFLHWGNQTETPRNTLDQRQETAELTFIQGQSSKL